MKKFLLGVAVRLITVVVWIPRLILNGLALIWYSLMGCHNGIKDALLGKKEKGKSS